MSSLSDSTSQRPPVEEGRGRTAGHEDRGEDVEAPFDGMGAAIRCFGDAT